MQGPIIGMDTLSLGRLGVGYAARLLVMAVARRVHMVAIELSMAAEGLAELLVEATWETPHKLAAIGTRNGIDVMMAFLTVFL